MAEKGQDKAVTAAFITLGCKVNYYETEKMAEQFQKCGFTVVDAGARADIYIVNTCTVTNIADRKSRQMLHRAKKINPGGYVVAVGCYVESGGASVREDSAVDAVFSNREKETLAEKMAALFLGRGERARNAEPDVPGDKAGCAAGVYEGEKPGIFPNAKTGARECTGRTRAYLKIQDGCNQFCSYCLIPYVRGRGVLKSTPMEKALEQMRELAAGGFKEVVLTGIHLSSYGADFSGEGDFVKLGGRPLLELLERSGEIPGLERIRLGSLEPRILTEEFLAGLSEIKTVCPHFHLSLQSGCDSVLGRMNRHYTSEEYGERVKKLRSFFPEPAITTDVIVGFPGETEDEHRQTRRFLEEMRFADIHVFKYSPRSGTRAAAMEHQVPPGEKNRRSEELIADTEKYRDAYGSLFLGKTEKVLFEETEFEDGVEYLVGHNERYVKIGVENTEAEKKGYKKNQICSVPVKKVMKK